MKRLRKEHGWMHFLVFISEFHGWSLPVYFIRNTIDLPVLMHSCYGLNAVKAGGPPGSKGPLPLRPCDRRRRCRAVGCVTHGPGDEDDVVWPLAAAEGLAAGG